MFLTEFSTNNLKKKLPEYTYPEGVYLCGGSIRDSIMGLEARDFDIFGLNNELLDVFIKTNLDNDRHILLGASDNLSTYKRKEDNKTVQIIKRNYADLYNILDSFDFTICQFAYDGNKVYCNSDYLIHLFTQRLVVHKINPNYAISSLERVLKYVGYGLQPSHKTTIDFVKAIRGATKEQIEHDLAHFPSGGKRIVYFGEGLF